MKIFILSILLFSYNVMAACPLPVKALSDLDIGSFYNDSHHSIIDPKLKEKHDEAAKPLEDYIRSIAKMSDKYLADPMKNLEEGQCTNQWILDWAKNNSLLGSMKTKQSYHERKWMLAGVGLVYGKTKGLASATDNKIIEEWLKKLADSTIMYSDQFKGTRNNHYYWEGLAVSTVGALTKEEKYLSWSKQVFSNAMEKIQKDGSLAEEMNRGKRAIHYHCFATAPLVAMASLLNLKSDKLNDLVQFTYKAIMNPESIEKQLKVKQDIVTASNKAWLMIYIRQNPNKEISDFLKNQSSLFYAKLGGDLKLTNPLEAK